MSYIDQAGLYVGGQLNYNVLGGRYPGGHFLLYKYVYKMFLDSDLAIYKLKAIHFLIHSFTNLYIGKLAYAFFDDQSNNFDPLKKLRG